MLGAEILDQPLERSPVLPESALPGNSTYVVHGSARRYSWHGKDWLSIKTFSGGPAIYEVGGGMHRVEDESYLIVNAGNEYTVTLDSPTPVEGFTVYFAPGFAERVHAARRAGMEKNLESPTPEPKRKIEFFERLYGEDEALSFMHRFKRDFVPMHEDRLWLHEQFIQLMSHMLDGYQRTWNEVNEFAPVRESTREDLYRRLYKARDYAHAMLHESVSLDDMAMVACLSTSYFLRSFKSLFGETPHQYITRERLRRAQQMLRSTQMPVTEVCMEVGFESLGSFSWLFKRKIGLSPERYRHMPDAI